MVDSKNYGERIAQAALRDDISAIILRPDNPFTWASGYRMPIYNDNRRHLRNWQNRQLITDAFMYLIEQNGIAFETISGTSTAGIAPAASLAQQVGKPILILDKDVAKDQGGLVIEYSPEFVQNLVSRIDDTQNYDAVMSTCPAAIIPAVQFANNKHLPFAYVREKPKGHGLEQQIEGIVKKGERVLLVDFHNQYTYADKAKAAITAAGAEVVGVVSEDIMGEYKTPRTEGRRQLHVEDLVSTGGSCVDEIKVYRKLGAIVDNCLAIFSYDFEETLQRFREADCKLAAALVYSVLIPAAAAKGVIKPEQLEMLREWNADPFNWGAKHGFPKVEKKVEQGGK